MIRAARFFVYLLTMTLTSPLFAATTTDQSVVILDPAANAIISSDAKLETLFTFGHPSGLEGPTWVHKANLGYLLFSEAGDNSIDKLMPDGKISAFLEHVYQGDGMAELPNSKPKRTGPNGMTLDRQGRLVYAETGAGQIVRLEKNGTRTILADRFEGRRLNLPNDLVYKSSGSLYFTDSQANDKYSDGVGIPHVGLYMLQNGRLQLLTKDITHPNGLAFSPNEKYLYANDTDLDTITRYAVQEDGTITNGDLFINMSDDKAAGKPDGLKVDKKGDVFCTGPGGIWIISASGKHLATILTPQRITNFTFGDGNAKTVYMTSDSALYKIELKVAGVRP